MFSSYQRGFTLIELLVVIAIVGILSSAVLASLALARLKGIDAAIKGDLHTLQTQAEFYYGSNNNYGTNLPVQVSPRTPGTAAFAGSNMYNADATIKATLMHALQQGGQGCWSVGKSGNTFAVAIQLQADSNYWWCVDADSARKVSKNNFLTSCQDTYTNMAGGASASATCPPN